MLLPFKALMCSQSQVKEVEGENAKLQLQVKELNEQYRARLVCYLQDLAVSSSTNTHMSRKLFSTTSAPLRYDIHLHVFHLGVHRCTWRN